MQSKYENPLFVELYDKNEIYTDDISLIRQLIGDKIGLRILECFSGTGRILIPFAMDGHSLTGIEISNQMHQACVKKISQTDPSLHERIRLRNEDVFTCDWGKGYDFIVLGCNSFYELPSAEAQEQMIMNAYESLKEGGYLFIDNNDYKGNWGNGEYSNEHVIFAGTLSDGTEAKVTFKHDSFDEKNEILYMRNFIYSVTPTGEQSTSEYRTVKHPVMADEVHKWLVKHGFQIDHIFGDRSGNAYTEQSNRAIFLAKK